MKELMNDTGTEEYAITEPTVPAADLFMQEVLTTHNELSIKKGDLALDRGSQEVAVTHLANALQGLDALSRTLVSPNLTPHENREWQYLRNKGWIIGPNGMRTFLYPLNEHDEMRLQFLNNKALGGNGSKGSYGFNRDRGPSPAFGVESELVFSLVDSE